MKMLNKLKKVLYGVGIFFVMIPVKIYARGGVDQPIYGVPSNPEPKQHSWGDYMDIFIQLLLIPLLLICGVIVFCKKIKCKKWIKIIGIGIFAAIIGTYIGYIISKFK